MRPVLVTPRRARAVGRRVQRKKVALVELCVTAAILCGLTGTGLAVFDVHQKHAADAVAKADLHNAVAVLEACDGADMLFPVSGITLTSGVSTVPCVGESLAASTGTTLTYVPSLDASSYVLVTTNSGGTGTSYCFDNAVGGSIRAIAPGALTC